MAFTFFFRDNTVLEAAADLFVSETMGRSRVRIWNAGCAMGPETYTLLMILAERMGKFSFENLTIDATDHDESGNFGEIITRGIYPQDVLCRIPPELFEKYFEPTLDVPGSFTVSEKLRSRVRFKKHDLLSLTSIGSGYSMIVCKNVLLHFTEAERCEVLAMYHESLSNDGLLVLEHTQKMPELLNEKYEKAVSDAQIYRKKTAVLEKVA